MIRPARPLLAVLGSDVSASSSPALHVAAARALGFELDYLALSCSTEAAFSDAVTLLRRLGGLGINVTAPFKGTVMSLVAPTETARQIGAVNTLDWSEGEAVGENTDGPGFARWLDDLPAAALRRVVVLGAGGAARAVIWALGQRGAGHVTLCARRPGPTLGADVRAPMEPQPDATLVVSTLPPEAAHAAAPLLRPEAHLIDLVYRADAAPTALMRHAEQLGARAQDGRRLLMEQGALAFCRWFRTDPEPVRSAMRGVMSV